MLSMRLAAALTALLGGLFLLYGITIEVSTASLDVLGLLLIVLGLVDIAIAWALHRGWLRARPDQRSWAEPGARENGERVDRDFARRVA